MEMKENLFSKLPLAPPIEDQGQGYRLQKINEIQAFLEEEVATREALSKKYSRAAEIVDNVVVNGDYSARSHGDRRSSAFYGIS